MGSINFFPVKNWFPSYNFYNFIFRLFSLFSKEKGKIEMRRLRSDFFSRSKGEKHLFFKRRKTLFRQKSRRNPPRKPRIQMLEKFSGRIFERENECKEETSQKYRNTDYQNEKIFLNQIKINLVNIYLIFNWKLVWITIWSVAMHVKFIYFNRTFFENIFVYEKVSKVFRKVSWKKWVFWSQ